MNKYWTDLAAEVLATSTWFPPKVVGAQHKGCRFWDVDGKEYLDFASGPGVANVGWNHPELIKEVVDFIAKNFAGHGGNELLNPWQISLAEKIVSLLPGGRYNWKVFFSNSGGEANEAGLIASLLRRPERRGILSFIGDFHGRMGFSRAGTTSKKEHFLRLPQGPERVYYLIFPQSNYEGENIFTPNEYIRYVKYQIGQFVEDIDLAIFELIQGEGGINVANIDAIRSLVKYLQDNGVHIMVDEVQSGFGRTGKFFAFEHYGIVPDIVAMSKAASGGLIPIGITAIRKDLDFKAPREHSNTFGGSPQACFVCLKVIEIIEKEKLIERARILGNYLDSSLRKALSSDGFLDTKKYIQVLPSGIGLMRKVDILTNYGRPWPEMRDLIVEKAIDNGLWLMGAGICAIRLMPPLVVKTEEIDEGIDKFIQAIKDAVTYFLKL